MAEGWDWGWYRTGSIRREERAELRRPQAAPGDDFEETMVVSEEEAKAEEMGEEEWRLER